MNRCVGRKPRYQTDYAKLKSSDRVLHRSFNNADCPQQAWPKRGDVYKATFQPAPAKNNASWDRIQRSAMAFPRGACHSQGMRLTTEMTFSLPDRPRKTPTKMAKQLSSRSLMAMIRSLDMLHTCPWHHKSRDVKRASAQTVLSMCVASRTHTRLALLG